jgi:hypothetical protein
MAQVLRHEVDLFRALRLEGLRLAHQPLERLGAVLAAHQRDGAEGAGVIAPLRDLEVAHVGLVAQELADPGVGGDRIGNQAALRQLWDQVMELRKAQEEVDFRNLVLELMFVALHETPDRHDRLDPRLLLELCRAEDGVDRFLLRGVDEAAGVDEDDVRAGEVGRDDGAVPHQLAHEPLGVHGGLVAAEGNDAQLHPPPR